MAKVSKSRAGLRFAGDDLDPAAVSAVLGASAASASRKGEKRLSPGGRTITAPTGIWCFNAAERTPADLDAQIAEIFARLTPDLERWRNLSQRYRADVFCGLFLADQRGR
jgi:hypothetical protein